MNRNMRRTPASGQAIFLKVDGSAATDRILSDTDHSIACRVPEKLQYSAGRTFGG